MGSVVIDANIAIALLVERPWSRLAEERMVEWKRQRVQLCVPALWTAEVLSALRKAVYLRQLDGEDALKLVSAMEAWDIQVYVLDAGLNRKSLLWAERLGQMVAYDAQYLALAEHLQTDFYTADRKLFHRCQELRVSFVKVIE